jgi:hypothetical protein
VRVVTDPQDRIRSRDIAGEPALRAGPLGPEARRRGPIIVHPVLFALLPVLFLYTRNMGELAPGDLTAPLLAAGAASLLLWSLLRVAVRDWARAGFLASLFWLWAFTWGDFRGLVTHAPAAAPGKPWLLFAIYTLVLVAGAAGLMRLRRSVQALSSALNVVAIVLVTWHAAAIGHCEAKRALAYRGVSATGGIAVAGTQARVLPNIYQIVLDGYAREDVLRDFHHYDNRDFLNYLRAKGFQVAPKAKANYAQTALSLASTLNLDYLDHIADEVGRDRRDLKPLADAISRSRLFAFLRRHGYRIVAFAAEWRAVDIRAADVYLSGVPGLTEFQESLLKTTPLPLLVTLGGRARFDQPHAERVLYTFEHLPQTARLRPPTFVFAHILCPHGPYVFEADGTVVAPGQRFFMQAGQRLPGARGSTGYVQQVEFVNRKMRVVLDDLLAQRGRPTVIIIHSDHGSSSRPDWRAVENTNVRQRMGVLMACYLPGADVRIDDDLSGVNVFRLVLNRYFGAQLPLLPNRSYYSTFMRPYRFVDVTDEVDATAPER